MVMKEEKKNILLVEDNQIVALAEENMLLGEGYSVLKAFSGERAVEIYRDKTEQIDLVLLDIDLGIGMDGTEAAERILAIKPVPILFISSHTEKDIVEKTEKIASYGIIVKDTGERVLFASIKMAFKLFEANQKLKESEKRFHGFFENMQELLTIYEVIRDKNGKIIDWVYKEVNKTALKEINKPLTEVIGKKVSILHPSDEVKRSIELSNRVYLEGKPIHFESYFDYNGKTYNSTLFMIDQNIIALASLDLTEKVQASRALEKSELNYRSLYMTMQEGFAMTDSNGVFKDANPAFLDMIQYSRDELIGISFRDITPQKWLKKEERIVRDEVRKKGYSRVFDKEYIRKDKTVFPVEVRIFTSLEDKSDKPGLWAIVRDITERKVVEKRIAASEEKYRSLFENLTSAFALHEMIFDKDGKPVDYRFLEANPAFELMTGLTIQAIKGRSVMEVMPSTEKFWIEAYGKVVKSGIPIHVVDYSAELGRYYDIWAYRPKEDQFAVIFTDITSHKRVENDLKVKKEELDRLFENTPDMICVIEKDGSFVQVNPEWQRILGYQKDELNGRKFFEFIHPDDSFLSMKSFEKLTLNGNEISFTARCLSKSGANRWVEWRMFAFGSMFYAAARDIHERVMKEMELQNSISEKEVLLKELQHRVKNNMLMIISMLSLESDKLTDPRALTVFEEAQGRIRSMMLIYEKLYKSSSLTLINSKVYLSDLAEMLLTTYQKRSGQVEMSLDIAEVSLDTKAAVAVGLITNEILTNSFKYAFPEGKKGKVFIKLGLQKSQVQMEFHDNGIGLPKEFDLLKNSNFGLKIVCLQVEELHGTIAPAKGPGTGYTIIFPYQELE